MLLDIPTHTASHHSFSGTDLWGVRESLIITAHSILESCIAVAAAYDGFQYMTFDN